MAGSVSSYERGEVVAAVKRQRARTLAMLEPLPHDRWDVIVTPGWRVREVAAHLIASDDGGMTGRMMRIGRKAAPVEAIEAWNDQQVGRWANRPIPALLHALDRWGRRVARAISLAPSGLTLPGPFGRVTVPWLGMMRVYDEWIHGEDVRRALELPSDDGAEAVRPAARHLFAVIPVQTLPRLPASASGAVRLGYTDLDLPPFGIDMQRRRFGTSVEAPTSIEGPAVRVLMVASGRDAWRDAETDGALRIEGDRGVAEVFLDALVAV